MNIGPAAPADHEGRRAGSKAIENRAGRLGRRLSKKPDGKKAGNQGQAGRFVPAGPRLRKGQSAAGFSATCPARRMPVAYSASNSVTISRKRASSAPSSVRPVGRSTLIGFTCAPSTSTS